MLARWRTIATMAINRPAAMMLAGSLVTMSRMGKAAAEQSEANEMYRLIESTTMKMAMSIPATSGVMAARTPNDVAMPRPPLNFKKTGQLWPAMLASPA